jgi:hypothetical protein
MNFLAFPEETTFLEFKLANGSGWLTSHRLIIAEHEPGHFQCCAPKSYPLKEFRKIEIKSETLTAHFDDEQQATIQLPCYTPSLLQEIKEYIEVASKNHKKP